MKLETFVKRYKWLIAIALLAIIALYFMNNPLRQSTLEIFRGHGGGYFYRYSMSGETTGEWREGEHYTVDSVNFPFWSDREHYGQQISDKIKENFTNTMTENFKGSGYTLTVLDVETTCDIGTRIVTRQYRDYTGYTMYHTFKVSLTFDFKTDKPVPEQILSDINSEDYAIVKPMSITLTAGIILAICIGVAIVAGVTIIAASFALHQSAIIEEWYDANGNLIRRKTWIETGQDLGNVLESIPWIELAIILVAGGIAVYAMNIYLRRKQE